MYKKIILTVINDRDSSEIIPCEMEHEEIVKLRRYVNNYYYYNQMKDTVFEKPRFEVK